MWEVARQRPIRTFRGHSQPVEDLAFASGGRILDTVSADGQLLSWDVAGPGTFPAARQFPDNPSRTYEAVPSPDGRTVAYVEYWSGGEQDSSSKPGTIQFRDLGTGRLTPAREAGLGRAFRPLVRVESRLPGVRAGRWRDRRPRSWRVEHNLQVWDPRTGSPTRTEIAAGVDIAIFTADGKRMVLLSARTIA